MTLANLEMTLDLLVIVVRVWLVAGSGIAAIWRAYCDDMAGAERALTIFIACAIWREVDQ